MTPRKENNTPSFDPLLVHRILLFTHWSEWPTIKPYQISNIWAQVWRTESFAENYFINILNLKSCEQERLKQILHRLTSLYDEPTTDAPVMYVPEMKQIKKVKLTPKTGYAPRIATGCHWYKTYWDILKEYIALHKHEIIFGKYHRDENYHSFSLDTAKLDDIIQRATALKSALELRTKLNEALNMKTLTINDESGFEISLPSTVLKQVVGGDLTVFVRHAKDERLSTGSSTNAKKSFLDMTIFLACGYPLRIFSAFEMASSTSEYRIRETIQIFDEILFVNEVNDYYDETCHSSELLHKLKTVIFPDYQVALKDYESVERFTANKMFNTILYHLLALTFVNEHSMMYFLCGESEKAERYFPIYWDSDLSF
ncbi:hypothetical protein C9374_011723 [Naegleria lovaniensis]|uniref:Uncharacterized protein n=1 Tax=Naegleria lovaniensis TaxID=51637 RepID=A0AA88GEQ8_NAELO|nr:uncharacterized protein C9374_011723 [Naegleria lovaniensis]KAG2373838.1 hypothetical protein C9374_011723 [Naegleria lovaniensis]